MILPTNLFEPLYAREKFQIKEASFLFSIDVVRNDKKITFKLEFRKQKYCYYYWMICKLPLFSHTTVQIFEVLRFTRKKIQIFNFTFIMFQYTPQNIICVSTVCASVLRFQLTWESMWYPYFYENLEQWK